jgi:hypothetical protein
MKIDPGVNLPCGSKYHMTPESPGIGLDIRNIYLFGKYRDFKNKSNFPQGD